MDKIEPDCESFIKLLFSRGCDCRRWFDQGEAVGVISFHNHFDPFRVYSSRAFRGPWVRPDHFRFLSKTTCHLLPPLIQAPTIFPFFNFPSNRSFIHFQAMVKFGALYSKAEAGLGPSFPKW